MKAALLIGKEKFAVKDIPRPQIEAEDQVLIKVHSVGVCGSDIHYFNRGGIGDQRITRPFIIGHECSGKVVEVGPQVKGLAAGEEVIIDPAVSCGQCSECRKGRFHTCRYLSFIGCPGQRQGALCEYLVMPASSCYKLPPGLSLAQAVIAEPLSIALHSLSFLGNPEEAAIGVLGCGPIGLSVIQAAKSLGCGEIYATDRLEHRLTTAAKMDIRKVGQAEDKGVVEEFLYSAPDGFDAVFECCGKQEAIDQGIALLRPGGRLIVIGIPESPEITLDPHLCRRKEVTIQNVRRQNQCMVRAVELLDSRRNSFEKLITHTFPLAEINAAFNLVADYAEGVIKALITL